MRPRVYWQYSLIPEAADALHARYVPLDELAEILSDSGFAYRGRFAPVDAAVQGDSYFDPRDPLSKEWRDGDSIWSLVSEDRLERTVSRIQDLDERGELEAYMSCNDALRPHVGQATVLRRSSICRPQDL